jgi:hypothetical protein
MSRRAIVFNLAAFGALVFVLGEARSSGIAGLVFAPFGIVLFIVALYIHLSGLSYSILLLGKCKIYSRGALVLAVSAGPLMAIAAFLIWGGT